MKIHMQYFAAIREKVGKSSEIYETEASSLEELYNELKTTYDFPYCLSQIRFAVNDEFCQNSESFSAQDTIVLIPPVAGG